MLALRVEKPPVDMAVIDWHKLSKKFIGPSHNNAVIVRVRVTYIFQREAAVWRMRGWILSWVIPVVSAL